MTKFGGGRGWSTASECAYNHVACKVQEGFGTCSSGLNSLMPPDRFMQLLKAEKVSL